MMGIITVDERKNEKDEIARRKKVLSQSLEYSGVVTCRHFKGNFYEVLAITTHTETREELVVYRNKFKDKDKIWTRPLDMFLSYIEEKDEDKYPDTKYRMTMDHEIELTDEQQAKYTDLKNRYNNNREKLFVKCVTGQIFSVENISLSEKYPYVRIEDISNASIINLSGDIVIYPGELFTENYEVVRGEDINAVEFIRASQLSKQIHRTAGRF